MNTMNVSLETQRETAVIHIAETEKAADRRMKTMHHKLNVTRIQLCELIKIKCSVNVSIKNKTGLMTSTSYTTTLNALK